jgi:hypothetical protein
MVVDTWTRRKHFGSKGWLRNNSNAYVAILIGPSLHVGVVSVEGVGCFSGGAEVDNLPLVVLVAHSDEVEIETEIVYNMYRVKMAAVSWPSSLC